MLAAPSCHVEVTPWRDEVGSYREGGSFKRSLVRQLLTPLAKAKLQAKTGTPFTLYPTP